MGERGPAPKPTNLRILEGNPSKRPINESEPQPEPGAVCPDWLSDDTKEEWNRLAPILEACKILTKADQYALVAYCQAVSGYKAATLAIEENGMTIGTGSKKRLSPNVAAQRNYADQIAKFGTKLGVAPADRSAIKVSGPSQSSIWDQYGTR